MIKSLITILATTMLLATTLSSAEIIPVWNKTNEAGEIHDMEFLRGEDQFILLAGTAENSQIQIRETMTGELVRSFPMNSFHQPKLAITPDSNRFVLVTGGTDKLGATIELRDISSFNLIKKDSLINTKDEISGKDLFYVFNQIVIDPIRPYAYLILERTNFTTTLPKDSTFVIVYNYETMQRVKDLTPIGFGAEYISQLTVSKDGKYLATLNDGKAYLKVWDLETYEEIRSVKLYDDNLPNLDWWCESKDIEFSETNSEDIYFSGYFPGDGIEFVQNGLYKYFVDSEIVSLKFAYSGEFIVFKQEENIYINSGGNDKILSNDGIDYILEIDSDLLNFPSSIKVIYSELNEVFVGTSIFNSGSIKYDSQTSITTKYDEEITISPNPTTSSLKIELGNKALINSYEITDANGKQVLSGSNSLSSSVSIDVESLLVGVYIIELTTSSGDVVTDKFVKE